MTSSSSGQGDSMELPDSLSPSIPIVIFPGRSSKLHPVSTQSWCNQVLADQPTLLCACLGVKEDNVVYEFVLTSSVVFHIMFVLLVIVCEMRSKWPYSCYFVKCCFQDLFKTAHSILVSFTSSFSSMFFISI